MDSSIHPSVPGRGGCCVTTGKKMRSKNRPQTEAGTKYFIQRFSLVL